MFLILLYASITVLTGVLLFLITKYLRKKPFGTQFVTDRLSVDLAVCVFSVVLITSSAIVAREILGPFGEMTTKVFLWVQQMSTSSLSAYILSVQVMKPFSCLPM
jgi:hypothetical protein